jgi:uncharacterized membrane protein (UPF0127 family)
MPRLLIATLFVLLLSACGDSSGSSTIDLQPGNPQPPLRTIDVDLGGRTITVEVADDTEERTLGLSYRDDLGGDDGMLFVWENESTYVLWMKGMRFPLDFVWLDAERRVVSLNENVPHQPGAPDSELIRYSSGVPAKFAIELNAGAAARLRLAIGDELSFDERR